MLLPDMSHTDLPRQIQANLIAYMHLFAGLPGVSVRSDAELYWTISNRPAPGNFVLRTKAPGEGFQTWLAGKLDAIAQHTDYIEWFVFPHDEPPHLNSLFSDPGGTAGNWLYGSLLDLPAIDSPPGFEVRRVTSDGHLAEWIAVNQVGFGVELSNFHVAYRRHGYGEDAFSFHFTGYVNDAPVTSGTLLVAGGCAAVYDISTPPALRGRGYGTAITRHMLEVACDFGYRDSWIWSSDQGKRVYESLGFMPVDFGIREHTFHLNGSG
jgi:GNAT superfamily N-acetyltransferase